MASLIIDTSAIVAILRQEPPRPQLLRALTGADGAAVGTPATFEAEMVMAVRFGPAGGSAVRAFLREFAIEESAFTVEHRRAAGEAFLRFGKSRHPARLNYGDCMTYAVAKVAGEPLLCVGDDFAKTDLELVPLG